MMMNFFSSSYCYTNSETDPNFSLVCKTLPEYHSLNITYIWAAESQSFSPKFDKHIIKIWLTVPAYVSSLYLLSNFNYSPLILNTERDKT